MYKVYRVTKTPLTIGLGDKQHVAEFWNPESAEKAAATMVLLRDDEEVTIEYTATIEEALNTDYFD